MLKLGCEYACRCSKQQRLQRAGYDLHGRVLSLDERINELRGALQLTSATMGDGGEQARRSDGAACGLDISHSRENATALRNKCSMTRCDNVNNDVAKSNMKSKRQTSHVTFVWMPRTSFILPSLRRRRGAGVLSCERTTCPAVAKYSAKADNACAAAPPPCA